ncbi:transcriptional regulator with XRE-family HTH domain [Dyella sp. SG562]|uniref:helix-turn-helix domain-containing protein n=1 Tax=unclassified Dyella TaxID=2634549 RepID=UPI0014241BF8|nr:MULTISPECIES: helix-turn-helix transcriptional regulator [unclassified Dyella]NII74189.1 transcriptional regulator with XRE-family HTH domain [Dyella sp. SG562]NKJ21039.1 transcriptional regulator with XRE-family HTH domain [Dyella sp. SG609]
MNRAHAPLPMAAPASAVGGLLREWRAARRLSQLDLALEAGISARHLSCVETGKSQASREMLARLADTLGMPLRERNALLVAAGFAAKYPETELATPAMAQIRKAIDAILQQQEPYPAFLLNRHWDVLGANRAAERVGDYVMHGRPSKHTNMLRQMFDPEDFRQAVVNWEEIAESIVRHLHNEVAAAPSDTKARALLDEVLAYPGVPASWRTRDLSSAPSPLMTTVLQGDGEQLHFFSTITTFGTPRDVTLEELHIECCFPMDEATAARCRQLAERNP